MSEKMNQIMEKAEKIVLLLTDCDGVLTDGCAYYSAAGEELKKFSLRDGMGVERLRSLVGVETGVITGELSMSVLRRIEKLKITEYHPGCKDKLSVLKEILKNKNITPEQVAYIGDDTNDIDILEHVGLSACPQDAMSLVKEKVHLVLNNPGGNGAFRELAEVIIYSKTKKDEQVTKNS